MPAKHVALLDTASLASRLVHVSDLSNMHDDDEDDADDPDEEEDEDEEAAATAAATDDDDAAALLNCAGCQICMRSHSLLLV